MYHSAIVNVASLTVVRMFFGYCPSHMFFVPSVIMVHRASLGLGSARMSAPMIYV